MSESSDINSIESDIESVMGEITSPCQKIKKEMMDIENYFSAGQNHIKLKHQRLRQEYLVCSFVSTLMKL